MPLSTPAAEPCKPLGTNKSRNTPMKAIEIHALGGFEVLVQGQPLRFVFKPPRKPLDLLKGLLTSSWFQRWPAYLVRGIVAGS